MNFEGLKRSEEIANIYMSGNEEVKETILSFLDDNEKRVFLEFVSFQKLFTDQNFYNAVKESVGTQIYNTFNDK